MIARVAMVIFGSLLIAIAIAWAIGPACLLAGLIAVPLMWGIVTVAVLATWAALWLHGTVIETKARTCLHGRGLQNSRFVRWAEKLEWVNPSVNFQARYDAPLFTIRASTNLSSSAANRS
jgi:hypothetical protein